MRICLPFSAAVAVIIAGAPQMAQGKVSTHRLSRGGRGIEESGTGEAAIPTQHLRPGLDAQAPKCRGAGRDLSVATAISAQNLSSRSILAQFPATHMLHCTQKPNISGHSLARD